MFKTTTLAAATALALSATPLTSFAFQTLWTFNCPVDGCQPETGVVVRNNTLYGPTVYGSLYKYSVPNLQFVNQHMLTYPQGGKPVAEYEWYAGAFYGVAEGGGTGAGTIFKIKPNNSFQLLYSFTGGNDGMQPYGQLLYSPLFGQPAMYGTTMSGGQFGVGTVFLFDPLANTIPLTYEFGGGPDGANPTTGLVGYNGMYYGTTSNGGLNANNGTLFMIDPTLGTKTTLWHFSGGADGGHPSSKLLLVNNEMYGVTTSGGSYGGGIVYQFDPTTQAMTTLCSFGSTSTDGLNPAGDLVYRNGKLYGTAQNGGAFGDGTVFKCNPVTQVEVSKHDLNSAVGDGAHPVSGLAWHQGQLYGTTLQYPGTLFSQTP